MRFRLFDLMLLITVLSLVSGGMVYARRQAMTVYGDQAAQAEWNDWREDATELAKGIGPVKRRAPKSAEPPALVLMRDYFAICLVIALSLTSILLLTTLAFVRGVANTTPFVDRSLPEPSKPKQNPS